MLSLISQSFSYVLIKTTMFIQVLFMLSFCCVGFDNVDCVKVSE